jgi:hypothetical protein
VRDSQEDREDQEEVSTGRSGRSGRAINRKISKIGKTSSYGEPRPEGREQEFKVPGSKFKAPRF